MWWHTVTQGGEVKAKLANGVGSQYSYTTSEHGATSISTADAHTSTVSSRLNWRPRRFKWTRPFRRKTKSGFCACAITFQTQYTTQAHYRTISLVGCNAQSCQYKYTFGFEPQFCRRSPCLLFKPSQPCQSPQLNYRCKNRQRSALCVSTPSSCLSRLRMYWLDGARSVAFISDVRFQNSDSNWSNMITLLSE
jgi:hypothetical protein